MIDLVLAILALLAIHGTIMVACMSILFNKLEAISKKLGIKDEDAK